MAYKVEQEAGCQPPNTQSFKHRSLYHGTSKSRLWRVSGGLFSGRCRIMKSVPLNTKRTIETIIIAVFLFMSTLLRAFQITSTIRTRIIMSPTRDRHHEEATIKSSAASASSAFIKVKKRYMSASEGKESSGSEDASRRQIRQEQQSRTSLYRSEGIFSVDKPPEWTSNDVVSYIRGILERDARNRGAKPVRVGSRRNKDRIVRVGHGGTVCLDCDRFSSKFVSHEATLLTFYVYDSSGTLDPLATGVLVIGVGKGTKELKK